MTGKPFIDWTWIGDHLDDVAIRIAQHMQLLAIPLLLGFAISFVLPRSETWCSSWVS